MPNSLRRLPPSNHLTPLSRSLRSTYPLYPILQEHRPSSLVYSKHSNRLYPQQRRSSTHLDSLSQTFQGTSRVTNANPRDVTPIKRRLTKRVCAAISNH